MSFIAHQPTQANASCHQVRCPTHHPHCKTVRRIPTTARPFQSPIPWTSHHQRIASPRVQVSTTSSAEADSSPTTSFPSSASAPTTATTSRDQSPKPALPALDASYESTCAFASYANWIIPGSVMLGRYPYVEPSRCRSRDDGDRQVESLIRAGITTFVCLQHEIPPQEEMRLGGVDGFLPYRAPAQLVAAGLSEPPSLEEISGLRTPELDRYLPARRRPAVFPPRRRIELDFLHAPVRDLSIPQEDMLEELVMELQERVENGQRLYVHCWGGRGRAGTIGAALLGAMYGLSAEEALVRVQRGFDTRKDEQRRSPETDEQRAFVKRFIESRRNA